MASVASRTLPNPVSTSTVQLGLRFKAHFRTSMPVLPGMTRSVMTSSKGGCSALSFRSASSPEEAVTT